MGGRDSRLEAIAAPKAGIDRIQKGKYGLKEFTLPILLKRGKREERGSADRAWGGRGRAGSGLEVLVAAAGCGVYSQGEKQ